MSMSSLFSLSPFQKKWSSIFLTAVALNLLALTAGAQATCADLFTRQLPSRVVVAATGHLVDAVNDDTGATFSIRLVRIKTHAQESVLHDLEPIASRADASLFLSVETKSGAHERVRLPEHMNKNILAYLRSGEAPSAPFDCNCFAHYVNGKPYVFGVFKTEDWKMSRRLGSALLKPGATIVIGHDRRSLTHLAIYLGHGLYLSKFGDSGPLMIADLESMKIGFGGDLVWELTPQ